VQLCLKHTSRAVQRQTGSNPCSSSQPASDQEPPTDTIFSARRSASLSEMGWCLSSTLVRLSRPASWYVGGAGLEGGRSCNEGWGCGTAVRYGMNGGAVVSAAEQAGRLLGCRAAYAPLQSAAGSRLRSCCSPVRLVGIQGWLGFPSLLQLPPSSEDCWVC
jgi:hypothetical protein